MRPEQLTKLNDEIKRGYKFLRGCDYDAKGKRLELTLASDEGCTKSASIEAATEPLDLVRCLDHEIYGIRFYHRLDRTEVQVDFGPTIIFEVHDEPETESQKEEAQT